MGTHSAKYALVLGSLCVAAIAFAAAPKAKLNGSIKVTGKKSIVVLKKQAKISSDQAARIALAAVPGTSKKVIENELEVERGFLVYCVDIKVSGQNGEHEVLVDAGTGKVLAKQLEDDDDDADDADD